MGVIPISPQKKHHATASLLELFSNQRALLLFLAESFTTEKLFVFLGHEKDNL